MTTELSIRRPAAVAGMFYPREADELRKDVQALLAHDQSSRTEGELVALISPHAGYVYSGPTAAHGYALLKQHGFDTYVLVGPSHHEWFDGASVFSGRSFLTPLGEMEVNTELRDALCSVCDCVRASANGHRSEHSLEVQIPFLQIQTPSARILPIVIGDQRREYCEGLGKALARVLATKKALLVASSDLSHFYSSSVARRKDAVVIDLVEKMDAGRLMDGLENDQCEACGGGPIVAVMTAAKSLGANRCTVLHACNSGDVTGDNNRVVGYMSAALWKKN